MQMGIIWQIEIVLALQICFLLLLQNVETCKIKHTKDGHHIKVSSDCSNEGLTSIPINISVNTTALDVSRNNLSHIQEYAFQFLHQLHSLNLSASNIHTINGKAFSGLSKLQVLSLVNNPVLSNGNLPVNVFDHCVNLKRLYAFHSTLRVIFNETIYVPNALAAVFTLKQLEELSVTSIGLHLIPNITTLSNLKVLNFIYGNISSLSHGLIQPLSTLELRELSFRACNLFEIANNTFDNFYHLKLLNFACNHYLSTNNVIDALSTSVNITIEDLILDATNIEPKDKVLGYRDIPKCRAAWHNVKRLSLRSGTVLAFEHSFVLCWNSLQALSMGFNIYTLFYKYIFHYNELQLDSTPFSQLKSLDVAYGNSATKFAENKLTPCDGSNWILENNDFFPPIYDSSDCPNFNVTVPVPPVKSCPEVRNFYLPPCVSYVNANHLNVIIISQEVCASIFTNNLKYINGSHLSGLESVILYKDTYGLNWLEVIDFSYSNFKHAPKDYLSHKPNLKIVILAGNEFSSPQF